MNKTIITSIKEDYIFGRPEKTLWNKILEASFEKPNFEINDEIDKKIKEEIDNCLLRLNVSKKLIHRAESEGRAIVGIGRDSILMKGICNEKIGNSRQTGLSLRSIPNNKIDRIMTVSSIIVNNRNKNILINYLQDIKERYDERILLYDVGETGSQLIFFKEAMEWKNINDVKTVLISYKKPEYIDELIKVHREVTNDLHPIKPFKILNNVEVDNNIFKYENLKKRFITEETVRNTFEKAMLKNKNLEYVFDRSKKILSKLFD